MLHDAAEIELGDRSLDHPGRITPTPIESTRRRRRRVTALALVASIVLLAGVVGFLVTRSEAVSVQTPADGPSEHASSIVPGDSSKVVSDAVDATLATSWVGTLMDNKVPNFAEAKIVYNPPDESAGRQRSSVMLDRGGEVGGQMLGLSYAPRIVANCQVDQDLPCKPGSWLDSSASSLDPVTLRPLTAPESRKRFELTLTGLGAIEVANPEAPPLQPGVYAVKGPGACSDPDCSGTVEIRDGKVVRLVLTSPKDSLSWTYGSFGDAPHIDEPAPDEIAELGSTVVDTVCALTIEVTPGTDPAEVESAVKKWLADNGRKSSMRLNVYAYSLDGVTNVVFSNDGGCEQDPVSVEVRVR